MAGPIGRDGNYAETVDDAQDDVDLLRVQLDLRRAERREVEARLRQAQLDLQRYQRLGAQGGISTDMVEHAKTEVVVQEARLAAKDAQIKEAALRLKQAERRMARFHSRTTAPAKPSTSSAMRPSGSAIPKGPGAAAIAAAIAAVRVLRAEVPVSAVAPQPEEVPVSAVVSQLEASLGALVGVSGEPQEWAGSSTVPPHQWAAPSLVV